MDKNTGEFWAIIGFDGNKARSIARGIEERCGKNMVFAYYCKREIYIKLQDDTIIRWFPSGSKARGYRYSKLVCDSKINQEALNNIILPQYLGDEDDIVWL